jgi:hypothetical protein
MDDTAGRVAHCDRSTDGGGNSIPLIVETFSEDTEAVSNDDTSAVGNSAPLMVDTFREDTEAVSNDDTSAAGNCAPLILLKTATCASISNEEIVEMECMVDWAVSVNVDMSLHTRLVIKPEPALMVSVLSSEPLMVELPFMLSVDIAGSYDQSASVDRLDAVAMGTPLSNSSDPTDVRMFPSSITPSVLMLEHPMSSKSPMTDDTRPDVI